MTHSDRCSLPPATDALRSLTALSSTTTPAARPRPCAPANSSSGPADPRDIAFNVPQVHRLRTTWDLAGNDFAELLAVLHGAGSAANQRPRVLIWADRSVAQASDRVQRIAEQLRDSGQVQLIGAPRLVPGGEEIKNSPQQIEHLLSEINAADLDRRSYIIAIGGGAMLDACGYAAALAHRGIRLVRIPTTTLAQADSGVGVKNAVNYFGKKNWLGTFAVPWAVFNDAGFLTTLPQRDFCCGFTEAVKVSLLKDAAQFDRLCQQAAPIAARDMTVACAAIEQSCHLHLQHITRGGDPFESLEARPLDFGHWSAHRLEAITNYALRHGEAVGIGVALDCWYSALVHGLPETDCWRVCRCLADLGVPLWDPALDDFQPLLAGLEEFRQHLGGRLTVTLLSAVGRPLDVHHIDHEQMHQASRRLKSVAQQLS